MSADKRTVSTDALETLGMIIGDNEKRDAIHLAVIPVKAGVSLMAGMYINAVDGVAKPDPRGLGIVDPFIDGPIEPGQNFWMVLRPRIIKSLRHVWSHPSFPDEIGVTPKPSKQESEKWLREFCSTADCPGYDATIAAALGKYSDGDEGYGYNDGEYIHFSGLDAHGEIPGEFWFHLENMTGRIITQRAAHFSCSC